MGEANRRRQQLQAQRQRIDGGAIDFARTASAVQRLARASSANWGLDCYMHAALARHLLERQGLSACIVVGYAAWRVGPGDGDVIVHARPHAGVGYVTANTELVNPKSLAYHAWLETGGYVFDVTTYQLRAKAEELDRLDGKRTRVDWCPDYLLLPKSQLAPLGRVVREHAGLAYYEADPVLQTKVAGQATALDPEDIALLEILFANPEAKAFGPNDMPQFSVGARVSQKDSPEP